MRQFDRIEPYVEGTKAQDQTTRAFDPDRRIDTASAPDETSKPYDPDKRLVVKDDAVESGDTLRTEDFDKEIEQTINEYLDDLKDNSDVPDTIPDKPFKPTELKRLTPEENATKREEFLSNRKDIIKEWESKFGREWPRYESNVIVNGHVIRRAGDRYDAHHIKPLCLGGENTVENITPIHTERHQSKEGIHAKGRPCDRLIGLMEDKQQ